MWKFSFSTDNPSTYGIIICTQPPFSNWANQSLTCGKIIYFNLQFLEERRRPIGPRQTYGFFIKFRIPECALSLERLGQLDFHNLFSFSFHFFFFPISRATPTPLPLRVVAPPPLPPAVSLSLLSLFLSLSLSLSFPLIPFFFFPFPYFGLINLAWSMLPWPLLP